MARRGCATQELCRTAHFESFKEIRNRAIVAMLLGTGITAAELVALAVDDLDVGVRPSVFVTKRGPHLARRTPVDPFAADLLRTYVKARLGVSTPDNRIFIATAGGKPMKPATLGQCVRAALRLVGAAADDESPRLLRNTYGRRHLLEGKTNEQVSNLLGLSSHPNRHTVTRNDNRVRQAWRPAGAGRHPRGLTARPIARGATLTLRSGA